MLWDNDRVACDAVPAVLLPNELVMRGNTWPCLDAGAAAPSIERRHP
jgi:hypothetical protein